MGPDTKCGDPCSCWCSSSRPSRRRTPDNYHVTARIRLWWNTSVSFFSLNTSLRIGNDLMKYPLYMFSVDGDKNHKKRFESTGWGFKETKGEGGVSKVG